MVAFGTKVEAQCTGLYKLNSVAVDIGTNVYWGDLDKAHSTIETPTNQQIEVNQSNKTMNWQHVDYDAPIGAVENTLFPL